uniref:PH domain-containing protein n=1 Tax=Romanomermis culicivorax TaxID=13658 RepID=A0A915J3Q7_ROMCU
MTEENKPENQKWLSKMNAYTISRFSNGKKHKNRECPVKARPISHRDRAGPPGRSLHTTRLKLEGNGVINKIN